jgi:predicted dehydrogenase
LDNTSLTINGVEKGRMYTYKPDFATGGVAFYEGDSGDNQDVSEQRQWMLAIMNDTNPTVLPEQAYVVSQILDGIYTSAKTGQPFFFNN